MKTASRQAGSITVTLVLLFSSIIFAMFILAHIILSFSLTDKTKYLVRNAAKSSAALINDQGETVAIDFANNLLQNYSQKNVTIADCLPYKCVTVTVTFTPLYYSTEQSITVVAASYLSKVGAFLVP